VTSEKREMKFWIPTKDLEINEGNDEVTTLVDLKKIERSEHNALPNVETVSRLERE